MRRGNRALEIRVDDQTRDRWKAAADDAGYTLTEFVRAAVEDKVAQPKATRPSRAKAKAGAAASKVRASTCRASMCEHRIPAGSYCPRGCDG